MTFLREMATRSLENPSVPLTDSSILELLSGGRATSSGVSVSPDGSMRLGTAFRCVQLIASTGGAMPLRVYRRSDDSEVRSSVLTNDPSGVSLERWETAIAHMATWGAAPLWKSRDSRGNIKSLTPIHPSRVKVTLVRNNDPVDAIPRPYLPRYEIDGKVVDDYNLLYIPFLSLDGICGLGPISYARETVGIGLAAESVAGKMFGNGLLLDGFLTNEKPMTRKQARGLKTRFRELAQGSRRAHDVMVMDNGTKFEPLTMPAKDAQFIEQRKFTRSEIAGLMGIPGWMLNDQEKSTSWGTGQETQFNTFVKVTLHRYLAGIEQRLNREVLPSTQYARFDLDELIRGDSAARAAFYNAGITGGWLTPNEPRAKERLKPVPWGDEPYLPNNTSADAQTPQGDTQA